MNSEAIEGIIFSASQTSGLIDLTNDNHCPSASFKLLFKCLSTFQLHYAAVTKATSVWSRQKPCLFTLLHSAARETLQNYVSQKLHFCMKGIYKRTFLGGGRRSVYFSLFVCLLSFKKILCVCGIRKYWFHHSHDEVWHKVNRKYSRQVMSMSKSIVDAEVAPSKHLLCTVWCNNTDLCPICKVSHVLSGWCQLGFPCNCQATLYCETWVCLPKPQVWTCCVLHDFEFGETQVPSPSSHSFFLKKPSQVLFIKIFHHLAYAKYISENIVFWRDKKLKVFARLERLQDRIRRNLCDKTNSMSQQYLQNVLPCSLIHFDITNIKSLPLLLPSPSAKPIRPLWRNPASEVHAGELCVVMN